MQDVANGGWECLIQEAWRLIIKDAPASSALFLFQGETRRVCTDLNTSPELLSRLFFAFTCRVPDRCLRLYSHIHTNVFEKIEKSLDNFESFKSCLLFYRLGISL